MGDGIVWDTRDGVRKEMVSVMLEELEIRKAVGLGLNGVLGQTNERRQQFEWTNL